MRGRLWAFAAIATVGIHCHADRSGRAPECRPTGGDTRWSVEGEEVRIPLRCGTGRALEPSDVVVEGLPPGASVRDGELTWTPTLGQAGVWRVQLSVPRFEETGVVRIGVADAFDAPGNEPIADAAAYTEEYGLPVFHVDTASLLPEDKSYVPATVTYRGRTRQARVKYRGATSMAYPKRNLTIDFAGAEPFVAQQDLGDEVPRGKLVLVTTFDDLTALRNRLVYELWNRMDPAHVQVRTWSAVVVVNGAWWGLYTAGEHIDRHLLERSGLGEEGGLFKAISAAANFDDVLPDGTPKEPLWKGFEKTEGTPREGEPGAFDDLVALVDFVARAPADAFRSGLPERLALDSYVDWWLLVTTTLALDSGGKNSFHWHPTDGRWTYVPWDFNAAFGQDWDTARVLATRNDVFDRRNELFRRLLADPTFAGPMRQRLGALLRGAWREEDVLAFFDAEVARIAPVALRDERRWLGPMKSFYPWTDRDVASETAYTRHWVRERWAWLRAAYP